MSLEQLEQRETSQSPETKLGGKTVHDLRLVHGLSQGDLAEICDLSQSYMCQIENGEVADPSYRTILALAKALGQGVRFFEGGKDQKVFLVPEASELNILLRNPELSQTKKEALVIVIGGLLDIYYPEGEIPTLTYLDHFPSGVPLGERICNLRKKFGLFQHELTWEGKPSPTAISQIESGVVKNPPIRNLERIANALKVSLEELLELKEINAPAEAVAIDRFFRSEVSLSDKREFRHVIRFASKKVIPAQA